LAGYVRRFYQSVRPWLFKDKENAPTVGSSFFVNQYGEKLQNVGAYFKAAMKKYFDQEITVGIIRKVMETAVSECSLFNSAIRDNLSMAMLHDPETARRYYVCKDSEEASKTINGQWQQLRNFYSTPTQVPQQSIQQTAGLVLVQGPGHFAVPAPTITNNSNIEIVSSTIQDTSISMATNPIVVVPTKSLAQPISWSSPSKRLVVPSLVDSPPHCDDEETIRAVANSIATNLISSPKVTSPTPSSKPNFEALRRPGDWDCSECGYTNFQFRTHCNHCKLQKNKRKAENVASPSPTKRAKQHDIVAVLERAMNKQDEPIYKVMSIAKGQIWVNEKHVPSHLL